MQNDLQSLQALICYEASRCYRRIPKGSCIELSDLQQEAALVYYAAMASFNPDKGVRFSTYFVWWLRLQYRRIVAVETRRDATMLHFEDMQHHKCGGETEEDGCDYYDPDDVNKTAGAGIDILNLSFLRPISDMAKRYLATVISGAYEDKGKLRNDVGRALGLSDYFLNRIQSEIMDAVILA